MEKQLITGYPAGKPFDKQYLCRSGHVGFVPEFGSQVTGTSIITRRDIHEAVDSVETESLFNLPGSKGRAACPRTVI